MVFAKVGVGNKGGKETEITVEGIHSLDRQNSDMKITIKVIPSETAGIISDWG